MADRRQVEFEDQTGMSSSGSPEEACTIAGQLMERMRADQEAQDGINAAEAIVIAGGATLWAASSAAEYGLSKAYYQAASAELKAQIQLMGRTVSQGFASSVEAHAVMETISKQILAELEKRSTLTAEEVIFKEMALKRTSAGLAEAMTKQTVEAWTRLSAQPWVQKIVHENLGGLARSGAFRSHLVKVIQSMKGFSAKLAAEAADNFLWELASKRAMPNVIGYLAGQSERHVTAEVANRTAAVVGRLVWRDLVATVVPRIAATGAFARSAMGAARAAFMSSGRAAALASRCIRWGSKGIILGGAVAGAVFSGGLGVLAMTGSTSNRDTMDDVYRADPLSLITTAGGTMSHEARLTFACHRLKNDSILRERFLAVTRPLLEMDSPNVAACEPGPNDQGPAVQSAGSEVPASRKADQPAIGTPAAPGGAKAASGG